MGGKGSRGTVGNKSRSGQRWSGLSDTKCVNMTVWCGVERMAAWKKVAKERNISLAYMIREAVEEYLESDW